MDVGSIESLLTTSSRAVGVSKDLRQRVQAYCGMTAEETKNPEAKVTKDSVTEICHNISEITENLEHTFKTFEELANRIG